MHKADFFPLLSFSPQEYSRTQETTTFTLEAFGNPAGGRCIDTTLVEFANHTTCVRLVDISLTQPLFVI